LSSDPERVMVKMSDKKPAKAKPAARKRKAA
jgi:hypothetical protein